MAQAARLNLRMQKELKLLLTDPPPGASFPLLFADSTADFASLTSIDTQIEGPEGTVYATGIFNVKIQIPERYPFQPPSVTFATPIYHPNIDNGGRICLDILNLPPKGAWQPSLNISTVLTSIGLLLSEPNPDDGLMCEASREYKYNRQVFDQKARAMTEKYAKAGASAHNCSTQCVETSSASSTVMKIKRSDESKLEVNDFFSSHKKPCGISQKLSLESSGSIHKMDSDGDVLNHHLLLEFQNHMEAKGERQELRGMPDDYNLRNEKLHGSRKLSLESSIQFHRRDGYDMEDVEPNHSHLFCNPQTVSLVSLGSPEALPILHSVEHDENCPRNDSIDRMENGSSNVKRNKICLVGKKLSLGIKGSLQGQEKDKENVVPLHKVPFSNSQISGMTGIGQKLSLDPLTQLRDSNDGSQLSFHLRDLSTHAFKKQQPSNQHKNSKIAEGIEPWGKKSPGVESVIVLDSEDSEEEGNGSMRCKLSQVRKRIDKRKVKA